MWADASPKPTTTTKIPSSRFTLTLFPLKKSSNPLFSSYSMDESPLQLVSEIGDHLGRHARPNKDFLVKSLRVCVFFLYFHEK
jgi:sister-chromatid-cohesion protein PDS5